MVTIARASSLSSVGSSVSVDAQEQILYEKSRRNYWNITSLALALMGGIATYFAIHAIGFHIWILAPWAVLALGFSANNYLASVRLADLQAVEARIKKSTQKNWQDHPEVIRLFKERNRLKDEPQFDDVNAQLLHLKSQLEVLTPSLSISKKMKKSLEKAREKSRAKAAPYSDRDIFSPKVFNEQWKKVCDAILNDSSAPQHSA